MPDHTSTCWTVIRDAAAGDRDLRGTDSLAAMSQSFAVI